MKGIMAFCREKQMKILYFDLCAIFILCIFTGFMAFRRKQGGRENKLLFWIFANVLLTTVLDLWSEVYTVWLSAEETSLEFRYILFYAYFLSRNLTPLLYQLYLCAVTDTWHILRRNKWMKILFAVPYVVVCLLLLFNLFSHSVFYFDENLVYTRGPLFYGLHICAFLYLVMGVIYLIIYKRVLSKNKFLALMNMYPWNMTAIFIQMIVPEYLIEMFFNTIALVLVSTVVQRPEEIFNPVIGIRSHIAYISDMKKIFILHKPVQVVLVKIVNFKSLSGVLGYDSCNFLMRDISDKLSSFFENKTHWADFYYLEEGMFAVLSEEEDPGGLYAAAEDFSDSMKNGIQLSKLDLELNFCICVFNPVREFQNYEKMFSFINSFHTYLPGNGTVTNLEEEYKNGNSVFRLRNEINEILGRAIEESRFCMYYQPIYSVAEKRFLSAEALIRLTDEKYGFISPELFITAAEKNGMILQIGDFVLDSVCSFLAKCSHEGIPIEYIELNLSMKQCMQKDLKEKVYYYLKKHHLKPEQINLEITETAANTAQDIVEENICELTKQGFAFSLDDFGTGYSNISRISELPFRIVKIDKSMTDKVFDKKMNTILRYNIRLLKEIGMEIVVEGVETAEVFEEFAEMGCDYIQGYYFSRPLPQEEFVEFIQKANL